LRYALALKALLQVMSLGAWTAALWAPPSARAGDRVVFERLSLAEGLSQVTVNAIHQDRKGFLWIGTDDGLNRYDGYEFKIYTHDPADPDTLSDNSVKALWEDPEGMLWVGTFNGGLNKLDPATGKAIHYKHDPADPHSLGHNSVTALGGLTSGEVFVSTAAGGFDLLDPIAGRFQRFRHDPDAPGGLPHDFIADGEELPNGKVWLATARGLSLFDPTSGTFRNFFHETGAPASLANDRVFDVLLEEDGALWAATFSGLTRFDADGGFASFRPVAGIDGANILTALYRDAAGRLWAGGVGGLIHRVNPDDGSFQRYRTDLASQAFANPITAFSEDQEGALWALWTGVGLLRYDAEADRWTPHRHDPEDPTSIASPTVTSMFVDRSGTLWAGFGDAGLVKYDPSRLKFASYRTHETKPDAMGGVGARCFLVDSRGDYWVGTQFAGLYQWLRPENRFQPFRNDPGEPASLIADDVRVLFEDSQARFWVGVFGGLCLFDRDTGRFQRYSLRDPYPNAFGVNQLRAIVEDGAGILWLATHAGLVRFDPEKEDFQRFQHDPAQPNSVSHNVVSSLLIDAQGRFWAGTFGGGLVLFDPATETFRAFRRSADDPNSLSHDSVNCVFEDRDGALWVGAWGGGLNRFDPETGRFERFTTRNGLPNNVVYGILQDDEGALWLSTNRGLCRFDPQTGAVRTFGLDDGLQSLEFNTGAYYRAPDGEMMFGGVAGFNAFYPEKTIRQDSAPPPVVITAFRKQDQLAAADIAEDRRFELSYRENRFSFEFVALDFGNASMNRYAYRMEGVDDGWIDAGARRYASYANLAPGSYRFQVRAANHDGVWNQDGVSIDIDIAPPFWQTWPFRLFQALCLAAAALLLLWFLRRRASRQQQEALAAMELKRKTDELQYARQVQLSMLPESDLQIGNLEAVGRMRTASEVGGDYFDFIKLPEPWFCIVWGDATGHGMTAGMIVGMTKAALINTMKTAPTRDAALLLRNLNATLKESIPHRGIGMGLGLALFNLETLTVEIAAAGMPFSYRHNAEKGLETVDLRCPPLGFLNYAPVASRRLQLTPGDALVFLSDGFDERIDPNGRRWGRQALERELAALCAGARGARAIADGLLAACDRFALGLENEDDMTVVAVRLSP